MLLIHIFFSFFIIISVIWIISVILKGMLIYRGQFRSVLNGRVRIWGRSAWLLDLTVLEAVSASCFDDVWTRTRSSLRLKIILVELLPSYFHQFALLPSTQAVHMAKTVNNLLEVIILLYHKLRGGLWAQSHFYDNYGRITDIRSLTEGALGGGRLLELSVSRWTWKLAGEGWTLAHSLAGVVPYWRLSLLLFYAEYLVSW